jgi:hypothetical protein
LASDKEADLAKALEAAFTGDGATTTAAPRRVAHAVFVIQFIAFA